MPQHQSPTANAGGAGRLVEVLGEIAIAGRAATVTCPPCGAAVGIDFADGSRRYGVVVGLDSDPRLLVEPSYADVLDVEERLIVLEQVGSLWYHAVAAEETTLLEGAVRGGGSRGSTIPARIGERGESS